MHGDFMAMAFHFPVNESTCDISSHPVTVSSK
jgi:hypothetical protein